MFSSQLIFAIFTISNKGNDIILTLAYDLWDWHLEGIGKVTQDGEDDNTAKHAGQEVTDCQDDPVTEKVKITRLGDHLRSGWPLHCKGQNHKVRRSLKVRMAPNHCKGHNHKVRRSLKVRMAPNHCKGHNHKVTQWAKFVGSTSG